MKTVFSIYWKRSFWKYLLVAFLPLGIWAYAFQLKDRPKENETLQVFFSSRQLFEDGPFRETRKDYSSAGILSLKTVSVSPTNQNYIGMFESEGLYYSDILFVPATQLTMYQDGNWFLPLDSTVLKDASLDWIFQSNRQDEKVALKVYDPNDANYNAHFDLSYVNLNDNREALYLCLNARMPNIYPWNNNSREGDNQALDLFRRIVFYQSKQ